MNANSDLERRLADYYDSSTSPRAPDWLLGGTLATIDTTPQRHAGMRLPRRFPTMNTFAKVAVAAVAVIAVGAIGLVMLRPAATSPSVGGQPSPSPSESPDPFAPPPLGSTFTSTFHGLSLSYPTGWVTSPATEPWSATVTPNFHAATVDHIYDRRLEDHLFLSLASLPLGGEAGAAWVDEFLASPDTGCGSTPSEPITIDGASGQICGALVAVSTGGRGYYIRLYTSSDDARLETDYAGAWFRGLLETVQLDPASAVDAAPSTTP